jgi:hypothetical protein
VNPVPDPLLLRKSGSEGNRTRTSGSVASNSDHWTTETVVFHIINTFFCKMALFIKLRWINGPGLIPGTTRKKVVGLELGPLSLLSTTEELLDRKVAAPV